MRERETLGKRVVVVVGGGGERYVKEREKVCVCVCVCVCVDDEYVECFVWSGVVEERGRGKGERKQKQKQKRKRRGRRELYVCASNRRRDKEKLE